MRLVTIRDLVCGAALGVLGAVPAYAQRVTSDLEATVSGGYSSSPFLSGDGASGTDRSGGGYVDLLLRPSIIRTDGVQTLSASGYGRASRYFADGFTSWSFGGVLAAQRQISARLSLRAQAQIETLLPGERTAGFLTDPLLTPGVGTGTTPGTVVSDDTPETAPVTTTPVIPAGPNGNTVPTVLSYPTDVTLLGTRSRQTTFGTGLGASYVVSARDVAFVDVGAQRSLYGSRFFDFSTYSAALGYQRRLNARTSVGLLGSAQFTSYDEGNGRAFTPQVTLSTNLNARVSLRGAIGALFIETDTAFSHDSETGISGSLNLCRTGQRSSACLTASRDAAATGLGAIASNLNGSASYSYQLDRKDSFSLSGSYSRIGNNTGLANGREAFSYASAGAQFSRRLDRHLSAGAGFNYRRTFGEELLATPSALSYNRVSDYSGSLFLTAHTSKLK